MRKQIKHLKAGQIPASAFLVEKIYRMENPYLEEIFSRIWHKELTLKEGRTINVHIRKLRSKISEDIITTFKGIGYKMVI